MKLNNIEFNDYYYDLCNSDCVKVELRKEFQAQETALQRSLSKLRSELQKAQEEARENRDKTNRLQTSLANAEGTIKACDLLTLKLNV